MCKAIRARFRRSFCQRLSLICRRLSYHGRRCHLRQCHVLTDTRYRSTISSMCFAVTMFERFDTPKEMAHSHLGVATDGRFIYLVSGQYGPQCRGPIARTFVLDTQTKKWSSLPPFPAPRACVVYDDKLFVIGGQEGDFMECSRKHEVVYRDVYMLDHEMKWKVLPPMPKPNSHIECAWVIVNNSIIITGGTTEKHLVTKRMMLVGEVFQFHFDTVVSISSLRVYFLSPKCQLQTWSVIGKLPYRVKTTMAGFWDGYYLYFTSGQRDREPQKVISDMWRTKLNV